MISQRIKQARLAAGFSLDECVRRLKDGGFSITKPALSYYENGRRFPGATVLVELGKVLSVPSSWFFGHTQGFSISWYAYRAQATLGTKKRLEIEAYAAQVAEKNATIFELFPQVTNPVFPTRSRIGSIKDADQIADKVRKEWNLGTDALESVTQTLETHGAMVVQYQQQSSGRFDGLSANVNEKWPLLLVNSTVAPDRLRFDLAHELGHVLMDTSALAHEKDEEAAAHRFASAFLLPPQVLKTELGEGRRNLALSELLVLKEKYGISVAAALYAARSHEIITESQYVNLQKQLSFRGWRKAEPEVFRGNEQPARVRQLVIRAVAEEYLSIERAIGLYPELESELKDEFSLRETRVARVRNLPREQRDAALQNAAEQAARDYKDNSDLIVGSADGFYEYE